MNETFHDEAWMIQYKKLVAYFNKHNTINVSVKHDFKLFHWLITQRKCKDTMPEERVVLLSQLGFVWDSRDERHEKHWNDMYSQLVDYKKKHGHMYVPVGYPNPKLRTWIFKQRDRRSTLSDRRIKLLNELGFEWNGIQEIWMKQYNKLVAYKKTWGTVNVQKQDDGGLWIWASRQRKKRQTMPANQLELLDKLGFDWGQKSLTAESEN